MLLNLLFGIHPKKDTLNNIPFASSIDWYLRNIETHLPFPIYNFKEIQFKLINQEEEPLNPCLVIKTKPINTHKTATTLKIKGHSNACMLPNCVPQWNGNN